MSDPRYLVISSDEHSPPTLDRGAWASKPEIRGDYERAAQELDTWCEEHAKDGIVRVSCGDTLDSFEPHPDRLAWLTKYFDKHLSHCQAYYYIQGQHDIVVRCREVTWLSVAVQNKKMVYAHRQVFQINDMLALFHDNTVPANLMEYLQGLTVPDDKAFTLFCHQLWTPWMSSARSSANLCKLPPYITWVISGDYHIQKDNTIVTDYGQQLTAWSVGPLHIQDISEPTQCRFLVYDFQDRRMMSIPLSCRKVSRYEITNDDQLQEFEAEVSKWPVFHDEYSVDKPIVVFRYYTTVENAIKVANSVCYMRAHLFDDAVVPVTTASALSVYSKNDKADVGHYLTSVDVDPGSPIHAMVEAALDAVSPMDLKSRLDSVKRLFMEGAFNANREVVPTQLLPAREPGA